MAEIVYLSVGANLGDRSKNICKAVESIRNMEGFKLLHHSSIYVTEPKDMPKGTPSFLNMAIMGEFIYPPNELLGNLEKIEIELGREKLEKGMNMPRPIDIDIILFGEQLIDSDRLIVPHKKMLERGFVLIPLLNIDPELTHPITGKRLDRYVKDNDMDEVIIYRELESENANTKLYCH